LRDEHVSQTAAIDRLDRNHFIEPLQIVAKSLQPVGKLRRPNLIADQENAFPPAASASESTSFSAQRAARRHINSVVSRSNSLDKINSAVNNGAARGVLRCNRCFRETFSVIALA